MNGPNGQNNAGTAIPPATLQPVGPSTPDFEFDTFTGELKCIVVNANGVAIPSNSVKGEATVITQIEQESPEGSLFRPAVEEYSAIGIQAIQGDANGDGVLELGGDATEYNACPNVLIVDHFFDAAFLEVLPGIQSELTLVPCAEDFRTQIPASTTAQFLVFNEFEQRFSTSQQVDCYFRRFLSEIDTAQREHSIFFAAVAGTVAGQTRIRGVNGGLLGVLAETSEASPIGASLPFLGLDNASNLHFQGDRAVPDDIVLP